MRELCVRWRAGFSRPPITKGRERCSSHEAAGAQNRSGTRQNSVIQRINSRAIDGSLATSATVRGRPVAPITKG